MAGFLHAFLIFLVVVVPFGSCIKEVHQKNQLLDKSANQDSHWRHQQINVKGSAHIFNNIIYGGWNQLGRQGFLCPAPGRFANLYNCAEHYLCQSGVPHLITCPLGQLYDEHQGICKNKELVNCNGRLNRDDFEDLDDWNSDIYCPYTWGSFALLKDCSKYIICIYNVPTIYSCKKNELFDMKARRCIPSEQVSCDGRLKPGGSGQTRTTTSRPSTTTTQTTTTFRPSTTNTPTTTTSRPSTTNTPTTTTSRPSTTTRPTTTTSRPSTTTTRPTTTTSRPSTTTTRPTTKIVHPTTTTPKVTRPPMPVTRIQKPNTPPPVKCRKDDVDCIENQTKNVRNWFDCPEAFASYPHPLSDQLFIQCERWQPFIKRCDEDTKYSRTFKACVWVGEYKIVDV